MAKKKTIALDFDGVIHSYTNGWIGDIPTDDPVKGSKAFIESLIDQDYEVVIFSARAKNEPGKEGIKKWLEEHEFPSLKVLYEKPEAEIYIDDRGYRFEGNFKEVQEFIDNKSNIKPWYKK